MQSKSENCPSEFSSQAQLHNMWLEHDTISHREKEIIRHDICSVKIKNFPETGTQQTLKACSVYCCIPCFFICLRDALTAIATDIVVLFHACVVCVFACVCGG